MSTKPLQNTTGRVALAATVVVGAIFIKLGLWQLDRAAEKAAMLAASERARAVAPLTHLDTVDVDKDLYRQFELSGQFVSEKQFLLDNRIHNGIAGYDVLTPFLIADTDDHILINRGWIAVGNDRSQLPDVALDRANSQAQSVAVLLSRPSKGFASGPAFEATDNSWPRRIQFVDYDAISVAARIELASPAVFVLQPEQRWNLQYRFVAVANGPEKHYGYAFQWFAMLVALLILYIYLTFLKRDD